MCVAELLLTADQTKLRSQLIAFAKWYWPTTRFQEIRVDGHCFTNILILLSGEANRKEVPCSLLNRISRGQSLRNSKEEGCFENHCSPWILSWRRFEKTILQTWLLLVQVLGTKGMPSWLLPIAIVQVPHCCTYWIQIRLLPWQKIIPEENWDYLQTKGRFRNHQEIWSQHLPARNRKEDYSPH